ncbi:zinc-dependent alcohol dehydrogenase family protein [Kordiimonas sp. SCSIO 12610]|uniref:zinc-dependent alcohol dehydrogenase family protein n=1 Tax=Kordiimonas sp. SCSIO 12610 TaxID=2829597 RepID=UPI00210B2C89|nr:zinc-dependent alcohol dehydrogenase family protein [Kordiimonas sp. SCSIO 12610]UTW55245.1 zinc-dependent alcohol dehydrogenase family protein [Kordiimonas sp. SCSIO 12610]
MRAAIYREFGGEITIENIKDPGSSQDGVVIKTLANGICRSDWHGWMGHDPAINLPNVPGHECCGEIVEVGKGVKHWSVGDRVIVPFSGGCGRCTSCKSDNQHICDNDFQPGFTAYGAFAEYCAIDYADVNLVRLPDAISPVTAASLGCRFMTSFRAMTARAAVVSEEWVVVHGAGGIGLSAIMIAKALGAQTVAVDVKRSALQKAEDIGADICIDASAVESVVEAIMDITDGGAHVSVDALGSPITAYNSIACLRKRGRHIQIGLAVDSYKDMKIPMNLVIGRELDLLGSHGMQAHKYPDMLEMITDGRLEPQRLLGNTVALSDAASILMTMAEVPPDGLSVIDDFQS